jgi:Fe-S-cluster containining protein
LTVPSLVQIEAADRRLLEHIAEVTTEASRRSGDWLVCRPGCTQCCLGPFPITRLDALRLRAGLAALDAADPTRAEAIRTRAAQYIAAIAAAYPGDPVTGVLADDFMDDTPCPALDPQTGLCDLYTARPITCRTFGPATRAADAVVTCELCYEGATPEQIDACAVVFDPEGQEADLLDALDAEPAHTTTIVAYALCVVVS